MGTPNPENKKCGQCGNFHFHSIPAECQAATTLAGYPAPRWTEEFDDHDNSSWEAASPYEVDESLLYWRLKQRLVNNKIEWVEAHDCELMAGEPDPPDSWATIEEAKTAIAVKHAEIARVEGLAG